MNEQIKLLNIFNIKQDGSLAFKHLLQDLASPFLHISQKELNNYYKVRAMVFSWLKDNKKRFGGKPTKKGNALYYYKQAMKYGDLEAALKYIKKYYALGGKRKAELKLTKLAHPLSSIPTMKRILFRRSLTSAQEDILKETLRWYNEKYK